MAVIVGKAIEYYDAMGRTPQQQVLVVILRL
jgi:hypothetical protein